MKLNKFLWDNYRETEKGKKAIELFENKNTIALLDFIQKSEFTAKEKNYEEASMLVEAKFWIKNNKELEETFKQVYSYGQRLSSKTLLIADKDAIWIYERHNQSFDRSKYIKKYWKELEKPDEFASIKKLLGRK